MCLQFCSKFISLYLFSLHKKLIISLFHLKSVKENECFRPIFSVYKVQSLASKNDTETTTLSVEEAMKLNEEVKVQHAETKKGKEAKENKDSPSRSAAEQADTSLTDSKKGAKDTKSETLSDSAAKSVRKATLTRTHSKHSRSVNLMQKCISIFHEFFHTLVSQKLVPDSTQLGSLLQAMLKDCEPSADSGKEMISLGACDEDQLQTFSSACQLLVEFASFPMYGSFDSGPKGRKSSKGNYLLLHGKT